MQRHVLAIMVATGLMLAPASASAHGDATELDRPVAFSGRLMPADEVTSETWEIVDDVASYRGGVRRADVVEMSDSRLDGKVTLTADRDVYLGAFGLQLSQTTIRIETPDGAWQEAPGLVVDFGDGRSTTRTSALIGEGGYAGWITVAQVTLDPATGALDLEGVILEGTVPPTPGDDPAE